MRRKKSNVKKPPPPFKGFTPLQRRTLAACWPARMSVAKREALDNYLAAAEEALLIILGPAGFPGWRWSEEDRREDEAILFASAIVNPNVWDVKRRRDSIRVIAKHGRALRLALEGMSKIEQYLLFERAAGDSADFNAVAPTPGSGSAPPSADAPAKLADEGKRGPVSVREARPRVNLFQRLIPMMSRLEELSAKLPDHVKSGVKKPAEAALLGALVLLHQRRLGKINPSENGNFAAFLHALGPMIGLSLGVALLKTVLQDFPQE